MDADDLHGCCVRVEAAVPLVGLLGSTTFTPQPLQQRRKAQPFPVGDVVQRLGDVVQVGEQPLALRLREHALGQSPGGDRLVHGSDATRPEEVEPAADLLGDRVGEVVAAGVERRRRVPDEGTERDRTYTRCALLLECLEQRQPLVAGAPQQHVHLVGVDARDAPRPQGVAEQVDLLEALHQNRDVAGAHGPHPLTGVERGHGSRFLGGEQPGDVVGEVVGDARPQLADAELGHTGVGPDDAQPQRVRRRQPVEPAAGVVGLDRVHGDARVAQLGAVQEDLQRLDQRAVGAVIGGQRPAVRGRADGIEVAEHVATAEGVDGLLRVADEHEGGVLGEGAVEDAPLDRVRVLELVDENDLPALPHAVTRRSVVILERTGEALEQVVERQDAETLLATVELGPHRPAEADPRRGHAAFVGIGRPEHGLRVVDHLRGELARRRVAERWLVAAVGEPLQVEVVGDVDDELVEVLHQRHAGVGVAGDTERREHQLAELVRGRDRGAVEVGERVGDAPTAECDLVVSTRRQMLQQPTQLACRRRVGEGSLGLHELGAHAFAQLLAGGAAERDDEHLRERGHNLRRHSA